MLEREITITNPTGLHARPATLLVKKASSFKSDLFIECNGKKANIKSLIGVLSLGVTSGANIKLIASGDDETLAVEEITKLINTLE
ncbi:HPr family phosphocarrier protein [Clostridium niameyense]|uniref:Phosphocarrier protein HPr n=1 Tax=Clostridium niameyense TaxID=1622073 RepID=A0A6M0R953_9CLOT|nr:HPr family phosphocarrier protein [Clostridium niameyense]NEZ46109.1 HPr family phosphocarrier protein [Clostridium niameyense]